MNDWQDLMDIGPLCHERILGNGHAPELSQLDIQVAGVSELSGHYRVGFAGADTHILTYTTQGWGELHTQTGNQLVEPNSLIILPAKQAFMYELASEHWGMVWFVLENTQRWQSLRNTLARVEYCESAQVIYHLLAMMYYEKNPDLRQTPLQQLEYYLSETINQPGQDHSHSKRLHALFSEVEKQLHKPWSVETMGQKIHYSAPHLHRLCKKVYGRSPVQQLIFLRVQRAQHLLRHTDWPIAHIASSVGYSDVFNFSKRFKRSTGKTPSQYRKNA